MNPVPRYNFFTAFFRKRTWVEFLYLWSALILAPFGLAYAAVTVVVGSGLAVTVVGLVVGSSLIMAARGWGALHRSMNRAMLATEIAAPPPVRRSPGFWGWVRGGLSDGAGWRVIGFLFLNIVTAAAGAVVSIVFFFIGLGAMTHWYWSRFLPLQPDSNGVMHRGASFGTDFFIDTAARQFWFAVLGALIWLFVWPALNTAFAHIQRLLSRNLLGPTASSLRLREVEASRSRTVDDADVKLRRIERDLHDGTQAQLVALAMKLGDAKDRLTAGNDPDGVAELLDGAHQVAKSALVDLRDLARGIHPPVLDNGLGAALETLAAGASLPVHLSVDLPRRPAAPIETIAYFCVMELVTNAVKHSEASTVAVRAEERRSRVFVQVRDDGVGGAYLASTSASGHRSGLTGLDERVRSVDGTLLVDSPSGGPTIISIDLPMAVQA
ncbi:sensor histidine kinase [Spelaeicoccus albus]|uniref:histidine kinase n=1 Tax=Spelaeicoccus albus TaxID=1280376 RepID=A0A7Z0IIF9_9MICO|nr:sensor domain-containing protein [Spelaeicoccus albus]NYI68478.1 signal transduction histidine kinase [Spelaeicoccus albus]